ncbi:hypothetical protein SCUCBS95973_002419 [Sporothrix curviconia]|uniref:Pentatricopeptide repeat protein n=1 Tax=Sporothrix curviconia TaxID=1260050 RepID=A0ABP0B6L8_9PEZI
MDSNAVDINTTDDGICSYDDCAQLPSQPLALPSMDELVKASKLDPKNPFGRDEDVVIRFFNQEDDGTIRETGSNGLTREENDQLQLLQGQLKETERMIRKYEARGANGAMRRRTVRANPKYDTIKELEKEGESLEDGGGRNDQEEVDSSTAAVRIDDTGLTATARRHVKNLNNILRPAARRLQRRKGGGAAGVDTKIITALWSRYGAARTGLAESWSNISPAAWDCLWTVLAWDDAQDSSSSSSVRNPRRMSHIYYLAKDMQAAGVALTDAQQLLAMEAMFVEGWPAAALENWRRGAATLGVRPSTAVDYWELGVRMCALQGDLERAERAADRLFSTDLQEQLKKDAISPTDKTRGDPRVLFQLIRSAAAHDAKDKAWAAYRKLRDLLGEETVDGSGGGGGDMTIEDYDTVVACFLTANHTEYAFDVFVDMMFSGALDLHQQKLQKEGTGRTRLPSAVANHFFFGKWLKRLIGAGDLDGAYRVLQFMQARGIMTASVQVNGLLGAWLRSGTAENQARADTLAWRMVESRRLFVDLRRRERAVEWPLKLRVGGLTAGEVAAANDPPQNDLTFVPKATVETFLLMADNYKNRGQLAQLEKLWEAFRACEMPSTDAFMMNQLLESYVHDGRADEARALYRDLVQGPSRIVPNAHTFLVLFKSLAVHRHVFRAMSDDARRVAWVDCRQLVAEMVQLASVAFQPETTGGARAGALDTREIVFFQALGRMVLHTFRKTGDYVGLCVMLQTLRRLLSVGSPGGSPRFGMTDSLAVELVAESSELQRDTPAARHRILRSSEAVEALLREVRQRRLPVHGWHAGDGVDRSGAPDLSDDLAAVVAHIYRFKCEGVSDEAFAAMYEAAVDELGVRAYL